jgi:hypothetical protein
MSTVPVFFPGETEARDVPPERLQEAVGHGGTPGVIMRFQNDPSGAPRAVPASMMPDAAQHGGSVLPFDIQPVKHPGFWASLTSDLKSMIPGSSGAGADHWQAGRVGASVLYGQEQDQRLAAEDDWRKQTGDFRSSLGYRALAPIAEGLGVNVPGMEQSAEQGSMAGVMGHASAVPAVMAASEGLVRGLPVATSAAPAVIRGAAKTYNAARTAAATVAPVAGAIEGGVRLAHGDLPGAAYSVVGGGYLGKAVRALPEAPPSLTNYGTPPPTYPGASLPAAPPPEVLQARPLEQGGAAPAPEPSAGLGNIPVRAESVPTPTPPEAQPTFPRAMERGPQPISGESALTQLLTSQDNGTLLKIAKSRGINVTRESQLKPGIADSMLARKIIDDFSPDELEEIGSKYLEATRFSHQFGNISPEAWHAMTLQYYFPDVKVPAAMLKRSQASIQANHPLAQATDDLTGILQQSLDAAKRKP